MPSKKPKSSGSSWFHFSYAWGVNDILFLKKKMTRCLLQQIMHHLKLQFPTITKVVKKSRSKCFDPKNQFLVLFHMRIPSNILRTSINFVFTPKHPKITLKSKNQPNWKTNNEPRFTFFNMFIEKYHHYWTPQEKMNLLASRMTFSIAGIWPK